MIVILLIRLKRESEGVGGSFQEDNRIHVYRNIVNSDQEDFLIL